MNTQIIGRITTKKLIEWINKEFERIDIYEYEVVSIRTTHYRGYDYEAGASKLNVFFKPVHNASKVINPYFNCFYFLKEYQEYINMGYELYLKFRTRSFGSLTDLEIDVRKINPVEPNK